MKINPGKEVNNSGESKVNEQIQRFLQEKMGDDGLRVAQKITDLQTQGKFVALISDQDPEVFHLLVMPGDLEMVDFNIKRYKASQNLASTVDGVGFNLYRFNDMQNLASPRTQKLHNKANTIVNFYKQKTQTEVIAHLEGASKKG